VLEHKTSTTQAAVFALDIDDALLFAKYNQKVSEAFSAALTKAKSPLKFREHFFVRSSEGKEERPFTKPPSGEVNTCSTHISYGYSNNWRTLGT
jgi:hypothetical protein